MARNPTCAPLQAGQKSWYKAVSGPQEFSYGCLKSERQGDVFQSLGQRDHGRGMAYVRSKDFLKGLYLRM